MKEVEFTLSSDKTNWMDTSVMNGYPKKVTIFDPRHWQTTMARILDSLACVQDEDYTNTELMDLAKISVFTTLSSIVSGRRGWVNGEGCETVFGINHLRMAFAADFKPVIRDLIRYELDFDLDDITLRSMRDMNLEQIDYAKAAAIKLKHLLLEMSEFMRSNMSKNTFTVYELNVSRNKQDLWLEEYDDWRVVQWTKQQQEKVDADNCSL